MNKTPQISVLMTVFNGERFIRKAIDSILNQTFADFEFIIVDNASTDRTKEIVYNYTDHRIILVENEKNLGQTKALNIGIKRARGEFIARMDADDVSLPERLELQYQYLTQNSSLAVVGSWHEEIDEGGRHIKFFKMPTNPLEIKSYLVSPGELGYYCISHPTVLIRRDVLFEAGLYNEDYQAQDYDLWLRIARKYKIANLGKFLVKHRLSKMQQTKQIKNTISSDCEKIITSNICYYLPGLSKQEVTSLVRMLQFKPQQSREEGKRILNIFDPFFRKYMEDNRDSGLINKIQLEMELFYLLQVFKTNPVYATTELLKRLFISPDILGNIKFYKKIVKTILTN